MASTESGPGPLVPVGVKPVMGAMSSTYASSTWSFALPLPTSGQLGLTLVEVRSSAGAVKDTTVTLSGNTMTIAAGEDALAGSDVATVFYTINYPR